jgi:hypothetical protein
LVLAVMVRPELEMVELVLEVQMVVTQYSAPLHQMVVVAAGAQRI